MSFTAAKKPALIDFPEKRTPTKVKKISSNPPNFTEFYDLTERARNGKSIGSHFKPFFGKLLAAVTFAQGGFHFLARPSITITDLHVAVI